VRLHPQRLQPRFEFAVGGGGAAAANDRAQPNDAK
jgi:hypothetical protein